MFGAEGSCTFHWMVWDTRGGLPTREKRAVGHIVDQCGEPKTRQSEHQRICPFLQRGNYIWSRSTGHWRVRRHINAIRLQPCIDDICRTAGQR